MSAAITIESYTENETTYCQTEWRLRGSEQFRLTIPVGTYPERTIDVELVELVLLDGVPMAHVQGPIILKRTGERGTYWSGGYISMSELPAPVLVKVMEQWMEAVLP